MTPADRPQLLHALAVALSTARHCLRRSDPQAVADALEQVDIALDALEQLRAMERAKDN